MRFVIDIKSTQPRDNRLVRLMLKLAESQRVTDCPATLRDAHKNQIGCVYITATE